MYFYIELKLHYFVNLELFIMRVKKIEPIVLPKIGNRFLLFLKAFFEDNFLWVMLGDLAEKKNAKSWGESVSNQILIT